MRRKKSEKTLIEKDIVMIDEGRKYIETEIENMKKVLEGNQHPQISSENYMNLYNMIFKMCTQKPPQDYSQELYDTCRDTFLHYIKSTVLPSLEDKHDEFYLREFVKRWENYKVLVSWLSLCFHYLDRFYIGHHSLPTLNEVPLTLFWELVYRKANNGKAKNAVIALIHRDREGEKIDRTLIKNVLDIYVEIGMGQIDLYVKEFENDMLEATSEYYFRKASNWIVTDSCPDYMFKAEDYLIKEKERAADYLHPSTEPKLLRYVEKELLVIHSSILLGKEHSGCRALLREDKVDDLCRMYRLFCNITKGLDPIVNMFKQQVIAEGMALVQQEAEVSNKNVGGRQQERLFFLRKVSQLHDKVMEYLTRCFENNTLFQKALKEAFGVFCNENVAGCSAAELVASYCDSIFSSKELSDEAVEETFDKVVNLLTFISDKDLFAEFYRKKVFHRLLFGKSENDDRKRLILSRLKQKCGKHFKSKVEGMENDLAFSTETNNRFVKYLANNGAVAASFPSIDLKVTVLGTNNWQGYKYSDLTLPPEMVKCVEVFNNFYQTDVKKRRLTWIYSLGTCYVDGHFDHKTIQLILGTNQTAALLLYNASDRLSYTDIKTQLNLADEDVVRLLQSLSCGKHKILIKDPASQTVATTDYFQFNSSFSANERKIRIPLPMPPVDERKKVVEVVDKERRYAVDASIVRIMKSHKVLGHQKLVMECVDQLATVFTPDYKAIKKRIDGLIEREFLERDKENPEVYKYLA